jgi:hypothetical protein
MLFRSKKSLYRCLGISLFFLFGQRASAQQYDSLLAILDQNYPQEKIYVHFDKPYYNPGETIWFKAYLFSANLPSLISKTMYAELIDEKGKVLERKTMPVMGAGASSDFLVPDSIKSTLVYVRAYTSWMLNFDSSFLYLKPIRIMAVKATDKTKKDPAISLNFFPEGGDLVEGLESRIAFKAIDEQGFPVAVKGDILDSKGQKQASFSSVHDGMGYFSLNPVAGEKYKAVWKDSKGAAKETMLPQAKDKGVVLQIDNIANVVSYTISRTENMPANLRNFHVVAQMQQQTVYMARINMTTRGKITAPMATEALPDGIVQVTVFAEGGQPLAERIIFVNHNSYYFITDIHTNEKNLTKKAKNIIQIDVGDTLVSNLSVSITDAGTTPSMDEESIYSHVLLSSDIKGYVHDPAYYFSSTADSVHEHLDLVMMTHGWRRFKWEDVIAGKWPAIKYFPQPYITVKGQVLGLSPIDLVDKELTVILKTKKQSSSFFTVPVTNKGEFVMSDLLFYDTAQVYYQFNNDKNKRLTSNASFDFRNSFITLPDKLITNLWPTVKPVVPDSTTEKKNERLTKLRLNEFYEGQNVKTLDNVVVTSRQKSPEQKMDDEYTSGFFKGGDGYTFVVDGDPIANSSMSVLDYLKGRVAGLQITGSGTGTQLSWRGGTPSLFMNEMTSDVDLIQSTSMADVAMVKVFRPPFFGAMGGGAGGAIAVYTKKGGSVSSNVTGLNAVNVAGYTTPREFYSPDYTKDDKAKNDYRTTLYWNPFLVFDKATRRVILPFYNNDNCKRFRVVVEGINEQGKLTREVKYFE